MPYGLFPADDTGYGWRMDMVAGGSRRIVVIKNIASNLIEEAILILRGGPDEPADAGGEKDGQCRPEPKDDFLLREAEHIINEYIKEHGLTKKREKRLPPGRLFRSGMSVDSVVNIMLAAAVLLLLAIIFKMM